MPIISVKAIDKTDYRITLALGHNIMENIVITNEGLYSINYIKDGRCTDHVGHIINIVQNNSCPHNGYILFDYSKDNSNRKERIYLHQVQYIKDITPNDAYQIALKHGFVGTVEEWLESMKGTPGKSAYEIAVECGYNGTKEEWIEEIKGIRGYSAYEIAVNNGFNGTEEEWLESLQGKDGKSAYELAVENGFNGTIEEWFAQNGDITLLKQDVDTIKESISWINYMN